MDRRTFFGGAVAASAAFQSSQAETTKGELRSAQYAIVEMMGYKKLCGRLSQGVAGLLQLDIPAEGGTITQMINPASVYRITIVSAEVVREYAKTLADPLPSIELEVPMVQRQMGWSERYYENGDE